MSKKTSLRLVALCYGLTALVWLLSCVWGLVDETVSRANGAMQTRTYTFSDVTLSNLVPQSEDTAISTTPDPWIVIDYNGKVRSIVADFSFSSAPGEVNLYYTRGAEEFTDRQKIWGAAQNGGAYKFVLDGGNYTRLRLDPCSIENITVQLHSLTINPASGAGVYFALSLKRVFNFILYPAVVAAVLACAAAMLGVTDATLAQLWAKGRRLLPQKK